MAELAKLEGENLGLRWEIQGSHPLYETYTNKRSYGRLVMPVYLFSQTLLILLPANLTYFWWWSYRCLAGSYSPPTSTTMSQPFSCAGSLVRNILRSKTRKKVIEALQPCIYSYFQHYCADKAHLHHGCGNCKLKYYTWLKTAVLYTSVWSPTISVNKIASTANVISLVESLRLLVHTPVRGGSLKAVKIQGFFGTKSLFIIHRYPISALQKQLEYCYMTLIGVNVMHSQMHPN